jgi:tetratricopeptide (TPR) repeat protein
MTRSSVNNLIDAADALLFDRRPQEALDLLQPLLDDGTGETLVLLVAGRALNNLGRLDAATALFERAVRTEPENLEALTNLGHVHARAGKPEMARDAWRRVVSIEPGHAKALKGLGRLATESGLLEDAAGWFERAGAADPGDADNWLNLAEIMQFLDRPAGAESAFRRAVDAAPERADIYEGLGRLLFTGGRVTEAADSYRIALQLDGTRQKSAAGLALCLEVTGEREEAMTVLAPFLGRPDRAPELDYAAGRMMAANGRFGDAVRELERSVSSDDPEWRRSPAPWYSLGSALDRLGRHDEAFEAWRQANSRKPATFDPAGFEARVDAIVRQLSEPADRDGRQRHPTTGVRPVFIVGMPRSGTTLVEQMLACHRHVHAGGERLMLEAIAARLWAARRVVDVSDEDEVRRLRRDWLDAYGAWDDNARRITDKFPANFMNLCLAFRLFPEAMVVWCRRDPGDTALSVFANDFNRTIVPWATRLKHIAQVWSAQERIMRRWEMVEGLPLHRVQYEDMVEDSERVARRMVEFLELQWDPRCLEFHESGRLANTASFDQVRRPVYSSSVGRSGHYREWLEPFYRAIRD